MICRTCHKAIEFAYLQNDQPPLCLATNYEWFPPSPFTHNLSNCLKTMHSQLHALHHVYCSVINQQISARRLRVQTLICTLYDECSDTAATNLHNGDYNKSKY